MEAILHPEHINPDKPMMTTTSDDTIDPADKATRKFLLAGLTRDDVDPAPFIKALEPKFRVKFVRLTLLRLLQKREARRKLGIR